MIKEIGYCHGIENYSRHFSGRLPGQAPPTLLDYLPHDALLFIDESHQTIPQLQGMYHGRSLAQGDAGQLRLPLAQCARQPPLTFEEFENRVHQVMYVSATPGPYELDQNSGVVRTDHPATGLLESGGRDQTHSRPGGRPAAQIRLRTENDERVLVTTLTKRMSEDLAEHYTEAGVKCAYLHSEITTLDRIRILRDLRKGVYDALIGSTCCAKGWICPKFRWSRFWTPTRKDSCAPPDR